jgi:hypothetical protein
MANLATSASITLLLQAGQVLSVAPTSGQTATVLVGGQTNAAVATKTAYGPFQGDVLCTVTAVGGAVDWQAATPGEIAPVNATPFSVAATVTTATQTAIRAAQQPGVAQCVSEVTFQNTSAVPTLLTIQDGNTTMLVVSALAAMAVPATIKLPVPTAGTAATALNYTAGTTAANILLHVGGFNRH